MARPVLEARGRCIIGFAMAKWWRFEHALRLAPASSTVTARRFWDQHEMSLQTATGRSLPYDTVRIRAAEMPRELR
jgi:hypothetical protein